MIQLLGLLVAGPVLLPAPPLRPQAGSSPQAPSPLTAVERALADAVEEERMLADVRALVALGHRMGGTPSGERAVRFREERFAELGLATEVVEGPERWCHEAGAWRVVLHGAGEPRVLGSPWPWGFSPSVRGRFPLALEPAEGVALLAERLGYGRFDPAPRVLLLDGETTPDGRYPRVMDLRVRGGGAYPFPVLALSAAEGRLLREELAAGPREVEVELETEVRRARPRTVVARLAAAPGSPEGFLLVCAHGDSDAGGPGANDNASGEAIVLEIARVLSRAVAAGELEPLPAEVRFALWGSEIHSTRHWLERTIERGERLLGVVNFDQSGFGSGADRFYVEPDDLPANRGLVEVLAEVLRAGGEEPGFPREWATNRSVGGTDSYVFSSSRLFEEQGLPALTLYTSAWDRDGALPRTEGAPGESWSDEDPETVDVDHDVHYHSAGDTPENTTEREPWNMGWCARVGTLGVVRWLERLR